MAIAVIGIGIIASNIASKARHIKICVCVDKMALSLLKNPMVRKSYYRSKIISEFVRLGQCALSNKKADAVS
jgi:hypothetical protein